MKSEIEAIRSDLESIAEKIADLALINLRENIEQGGENITKEDRQLTRVRRSLEKAIHLLSELE
mgnify:CR=1 FL=1|tara:strand:+ start:273 stop:464 length:192 start_codon:yes stop_codon:yes gene_type:complete